MIELTKEISKQDIENANLSKPWMMRYGHKEKILKKKVIYRILTIVYNWDSQVQTEKISSTLKEYNNSNNNSLKVHNAPILHILFKLFSFPSFQSLISVT